MEQHFNEPTGWWGESRRIRTLPAQISTAAHGGRKSIWFISSSHARRCASVPNADSGSALGVQLPAAAAPTQQEEGVFPQGCANSTRRRGVSSRLRRSTFLPIVVGCGARRLRAVCQGGARCCHVSRRSTGRSVLPGERRAEGGASQSIREEAVVVEPSDGQANQPKHKRGKERREEVCWAPRTYCC
jgi:hypothetical protein